MNVIVCSLEWIDDNYIVHVAVLFNTFVISSLWIIINLNHMIFLQLSVVVPKMVKKKNIYIYIVQKTKFHCRTRNSLPL